MWARSQPKETTNTMSNSLPGGACGMSRRCLGRQVALIGPRALECAHSTTTLLAAERRFFAAGDYSAVAALIGGQWGALDVQWAPSSRSNDVLARACTRSDQAGFNLAQRSLGVPPGGGARPPWFSLRPTHPAGLGLVAASEPSHRALHAALLAIAGHDRSAEEAVEAVVGAGGHEPVRLDAIPAPATPAPPPC
jgi:hypothetical protein